MINSNENIKYNFLFSPEEVPLKLLKCVEYCEFYANGEAVLILKVIKISSV